MPSIHLLLAPAGPSCFAPPPASRYLTAIQLTSQHLLRYLAVAVVVNKRRRNVLADLKRVISQEAYEYRWALGCGCLDAVVPPPPA